MGIGGSIFLIVVGAIIAFGVNNQAVGPFDLNVIGWILMLAGFVGLALTMWVWNSRRTRVVSQAPPPPPAAGGVVGPNEQVVQERYTERRSTDY